MIYKFDELLSHAGHEVECVYYGQKSVAHNAAIECITCGCVLVDLSPGDTLSKELADDPGIVEQLRKDAVPLPTTEHAKGYNRGIEQAIKRIEGKE